MTDDLAEAIDAHALVRAALERAADVLEQHRDYGMVGPDGDFLGSEAEVIAHGNSVHYAMQDVLSLASDPAEVAAIISAASQLNKAEDENKEQRDEEDRG
jgi:hypothetical protein